MRCICTMFAEDAGHIPEGSFQSLPPDPETQPAVVGPVLQALRAGMDAGARALARAYH